MSPAKREFTPITWPAWVFAEFRNLRVPSDAPGCHAGSRAGPTRKALGFFMAIDATLASRSVEPWLA